MLADADLPNLSCTGLVSHFGCVTTGEAVRFRQDPQMTYEALQTIVLNLHSEIVKKTRRGDLVTDEEYKNYAYWQRKALVASGFYVNQTQESFPKSKDREEIEAFKDAWIRHFDACFPTRS